MARLLGRTADVQVTPRYITKMRSLPVLYRARGRLLIVAHSTSRNIIFIMPPPARTTQGCDAPDHVGGCGLLGRRDEHHAAPRQHGHGVVGGPHGLRPPRRRHVLRRQHAVSRQEVVRSNLPNKQHTPFVATALLLCYMTGTHISTCISAPVSTALWLHGCPPLMPFIPGQAPKHTACFARLAMAAIQPISSWPAQRHRHAPATQPPPCPSRSCPPWTAHATHNPTHATYFTPCLYHPTPLPPAYLHLPAAAAPELHHVSPNGPNPKHNQLSPPEHVPGPHRCCTHPYLARVHPTLRHLLVALCRPAS